MHDATKCIDSCLYFLNYVLADWDNTPLPVFTYLPNVVCTVMRMSFE